MSYVERLERYADRLAGELEQEIAEIREWLETEEHEDLRAGHGERLDSLERELQSIRTVAKKDITYCR